MLYGRYSCKPPKCVCAYLEAHGCLDAALQAAIEVVDGYRVRQGTLEKAQVAAEQLLHTQPT